MGILAKLGDIANCISGCPKLVLISVAEVKVAEDWSAASFWL